MQNLFEGQNGFLNNPKFLAGLAMLRGQPADQAWSQAAFQSYEYQKLLNDQAQLERRNYIEQLLPNIIRNLNADNPREALSDLVAAGIPAQEAALILERLGLGGRQISQGITQPALTTSELRVNATQLKDLDNLARNAERELRLLEDSASAFDEFDKSSGSLLGAGSVGSKLFGYLPSFAENIYSPEAQAAKQKIDKLNSQLYQNRVQALGARGTDAAKKEIKKGLPSTELTPDARRDVLTTKKRENYEIILRDKFFNQWAKAFGRDLNGAESAFNTFISMNDLLDGAGNINKNLLSLIPQFIAQVDSMDSGLENPNDQSMDTLYNDFADVSLDELLKEKARRR